MMYINEVKVKLKNAHVGEDLSYGNESCRVQRDNHVVCRFTNVFVKIGV